MGLEGRGEGAASRSCHQHTQPLSNTRPGEGHWILGPLPRSLCDHGIHISLGLSFLRPKQGGGKLGLSSSTSITDLQKGGGRGAAAARPRKEDPTQEHLAKSN